MNQWNDFVNRVAPSLTNFGKAMWVEKPLREDAEQQNKIGRDFLYSQYQSLSDSNKRLIDKANTNIGNDNEVLTQNKNVSLPPVDQQVQDSYEKIFGQTQTGLNDILMKLKNNKYGQEYAKGLEQLYGQLFGKPEYKILDTKEGVIAVNPNTLQSKVIKAYEKKPKKYSPVAGLVYQPVEKDGEYFIKGWFKDETGDMEQRSEKVDKDTYQYYKDMILNPQQKSDIIQSRSENIIRFKFENGLIGNKSATKGGKLDINQVTNDIYSSLLKARNSFIKSGVFDSNALQNELMNLGFDITGFTADQARLLFEEMGKLPKKDFLKKIRTISE
jgi:hypothetical protein